MSILELLNTCFMITCKEKIDEAMKIRSSAPVSEWDIIIIKAK